MRTDLYITIFTDASHCQETKAGGFGGWVKYGMNGSTFRTGGKMLGCNNSTQAEAEAIRRTLDRAMENSNINWNDKVIVIQTDCQGIIEKMKPEIKKKLKPLKVRAVVLKWVRGHSGYNNPRSAVNEYCDTVAGEHMRKMRQQIRNGEAEEVTR